MKVWVPVLAAVLAAVIGLAGGIGGAWIGGSVANEGQQKQFKNQRLAHAQDLLEAEYSNFLGAAQAVVTDRNLAMQRARASGQRVTHHGGISSDVIGSDKTNLRVGCAEPHEIHLFLGVVPRCLGRIADLRGLGDRPQRLHRRCAAGHKDRGRVKSLAHTRRAPHLLRTLPEGTRCGPCSPRSTTYPTPPDRRPLLHPVRR